MQYFFQDHHSSDLILFFAGWGCDAHQFANLKDGQDVLILFDYQDLNLDFDFGKYAHIDLVAYSAGVFVASVMRQKLPPLCRKTALCGNPYLFDEQYGLSTQTVSVLEAVDMSNYLDFRRKYMVQTDEEYQKYNELESRRTLESCQKELVFLKKLYQQHKDSLTDMFDLAFAAENDLLFDLQAQKCFYRERLRIIPQAKHHIFFRLTSLAETLRP